MQKDLTKIRFCLKQEKGYVENSDIVFLNEQEIDFFQKSYEKLNIENELVLIAHFFRLFENKRATDKFELLVRINILLSEKNNGRGISEEKIKSITKGKYIDLSDFELLERMYNNYEI